MTPCIPWQVQPQAARAHPPACTRSAHGSDSSLTHDAAGRVVKGSDTVVRTHADAGRLAGALTSCSLPMSYRVTVDGARMM
jgi:hypothetical protein